jgi:hypothetical protein
MILARRRGSHQSIEVKSSILVWPLLDGAPTLKW